MPLLAGITSFFDRYVLGYALGTAAGPSLEPFVQDLANEGWTLNPVRPPDVYTLAEGVAQGQVDEGDAKGWASEQGISSAAFDALVSIANTGPALGMAFEAWRRGQLSDGEFDTALKRAAIEEQWYAALRSLKDTPLEPAEIAKAVHRGIMADDGLLVVAPPTAPGKVPAVPPSPLSPLTEASWSGVTAERLRILVGNAGLPPGIVQMLQLLNRGEITEDDFLRGVGESNLRNEWGPAILALRRHLLTPHEYAEAELRGVMAHGDALAGAGLSGLEPGDYATLFAILGRPLNVHDITKALAHGVKLGGSYADVPEPYQDAIRRSNIRPEYAQMAYANRYTYPSAFVLRTLTQAGDLSEQQAHDILTFEGWDPALAQTVAAKWAEPAGAKADPWVGKADTQLWTATHKGYKGGSVTVAQAQASFDLIGIDAAAQTEVLARWDAEKAL